MSQVFFAKNGTQFGQIWPPETQLQFTSPYRGSPFCTIFHHPSNREIWYSNVLPITPPHFGVRRIQLNGIISPPYPEVLAWKYAFFYATPIFLGQTVPYISCGRFRASGPDFWTCPTRQKVSPHPPVRKHSCGRWGGWSMLFQWDISPQNGGGLTAPFSSLGDRRIKLASFIHTLPRSIFMVGWFLLGFFSLFDLDIPTSCSILFTGFRTVFVFAVGHFLPLVVKFCRQCAVLKGY